MGRRKQFCPQKTGISEANEDNKNEDHSENGVDEGDSSSEAVQRIKEEDEEAGLGEGSSLDSIKRPSSEEREDPSLQRSPFKISPSQQDLASTILAAQQSLFHPAALLSLTPSSLYAVQLAQLQAAQLLSQQPPPLKRKHSDRPLEDSPSSPLDLSGPPKEEASPPKRAPSLEDKVFMNSVSREKPLRHSAWQSQWINRGEENAKDIFKCTWCRECFHSFQALTHHMKETKHFGPPSSSSSSPPTTTAAFKASPPPPPPPISPPTKSSSESASECAKKRDILKEQLPIPRKLVRGQDVWLGKGEEQTRNILKCMWCGESFRSLDAMTKHMQDTKHYTKVISQDQISSWKSTSSGGPSSSNGNSGGGPPTTTMNTQQQTPNLPLPSPSSPKEDKEAVAMSSILTCKVCDTCFHTLKDLSDHMIKANHCMSRPPSPRKNPSPPASNFLPKEKRKKSLPVKKLLELERSHEKGTSMKFPCDKCGVSFPFHLFADHIRNCNGSPPPQDSRTSPPVVSSPRRPPSGGGRIRSSSREGGGNILGSLEQMVSGNFKGVHKQEDVLIPVFKDDEGEDEEDIAVDEDEPMIKPPPAAKEKCKNPLEALQMLCDKNEKHTSNYYAQGHYGGGGGCSPPEAGGGTPAFPWSSPSPPEALFKCPFCETPFVSKGAYRNHLSKMHFVKDPSVMMMMDPASIMALAAGIPSGFFPAGTLPNPGGHHPLLGAFGQPPPPPPSCGSPEAGEDSNSSSSKFEKYSQLAKQLSNQRKPLSSPA